jgi:hypothetical protein
MLIAVPIRFKEGFFTSLMVWEKGKGLNLPFSLFFFSLNRTVLIAMPLQCKSIYPAIACKSIQNLRNSFFANLDSTSMMY